MHRSVGFVSNCRRFVACAVILSPLALAAAAGAAPAWFNNNASQRGFLPDVPDFFQHQRYGTVNNATKSKSWETDQSQVLSELQTLGGWCRPTAIVNTLGRLEKNGFKGVTEAKINDGGGDWRAAANSAITTLRDHSYDAGIQAYLDARRATDDGKKWATKLLFNQYTVNANGTVVVDGKTIREEDKTTAVNSFDVYKRLLLNEQGVMLRVEKDATKTYSDTLWWGSNSFHYVTGAGISEAGGKKQIFFADPDSNKGNKSAKAGYVPGSSLSADAGDGGWVFEQTDRTKVGLDRFTIVDARTGAAIDTTKKYTLVTDFTPDGVDGSGNPKEKLKVIFKNGAKATDTGPLAVLKKGDDANIDARRYDAGDSDRPVPARTGAKADPTGFEKYYGAFEFDTSALNKAYTIIKSDDNTGAINDKGRYKDVNITRFETISKSPVADQLAPVPGVGGLKTELKLVNAITNPVDKFQIVPRDGNAAVASVAASIDDLNGKSFFDSGGGMWRASFLAIGSLDAWGNVLDGGAWQFEMVSGSGLQPFDALDSVTEPQSLSLFVKTSMALSHYNLYSHVMALADDDGFMRPGYWMMHALGAFEELMGDQLADRAYDAILEVPTPSGGAVLALFGLVFSRRRR